jgi:GIY-YIG catalytic domain
MFDLFDFDLPGAVTEQLEKRLQSMPSSRLTEQSLRDLAQFEKQHKLWQGVYQLLLKDEIVYVGKATDVGERLEQHYWKLRGRQKITMEDVHFRCLVLHGNWSTSANEDLLIAHYKAKGQSKWNGSGFGPKDVGRERDGTEPNWFDREYPINADYPCEDVPDRVALLDLLQSLKRQLPFTFRYEIPKADAAKPLSLKDVPRTARTLISKIVTSLGPEWQATIFVSHIILYKERRAYKHGQALLSVG